MSWMSIDQYAQQSDLPVRIVKRQIAEGKILARKFQNEWFIKAMNEEFEPMVTTGYSNPRDLVQPGTGGGSDLKEVVSFSSKALHHYLMMSEKLVAEKDLRIKEKDQELQAKKQAVADLEGYVQLLENELEKQKEKPEGWY